MVAESVGYRIAGLFQITRFTNSIYGAVYTLAGAYLTGGLTAALSLQAWGAAAVVAIVVAYGFVINDYVDVTVDSYSKPQRAIPSGRLARGEALNFAIVLAVLALTLAGSLGLPMGLVALSTVALATFYSFSLKGTVLWGNACMAVLIACLPLYGALSSGSLPPIVWIAAGLMWLFDFSHEILKTTADYDGDAQAGLATVATVFGVAGALRIFQIAAVLFILVALLPWMIGQASVAYMLAIIPCGLLPTAAVVGLLVWRGDDAMITLTLKIMRYMWISNLLPIMLLGAS